MVVTVIGRDSTCATVPFIGGSFSGTQFMRKVEKSQVEKSPQDENSLESIDSATNKLPTVKVSWNAKMVLDGIQDEASRARKPKPNQWEVIDSWLAAYESMLVGNFPKTVSMNYDALLAKAVEARNRAAHSGVAPDLVALYRSVELMLLALNKFFEPANPPGDPAPIPIPMRSQSPEKVKPPPAKRSQSG